MWLMEEGLPEATPEVDADIDTVEINGSTRKEEESEIQNNKSDNGSKFEQEIAPIHAIALTSHLYKMYKNKQNADTIIRCGDQLFEIHSPVLSFGSNYFRALFQDGQSSSSSSTSAAILDIDFGIASENIKPDIFTLLVECLYTGILRNVNEDNISPLLLASNLLQIPVALQTCTEFMSQHLNIKNCLHFYLTANKVSTTHCLLVRERAIRMLGRHLEIIHQTPQFLELTLDEILLILQHDHLAVTSEKFVYDAAMSWIKYNLPQREQHLNLMLDSVRLHHIPMHYLLTVVGQEDLIETNHEAMSKYSKALKGKLINDLICCGLPKPLKKRDNIWNTMVATYEIQQDKFSTHIHHPFCPPNCLKPNDEEQEFQPELEPEPEPEFELKSESEVEPEIQHVGSFSFPSISNCCKPQEEDQDENQEDEKENSDNIIEHKSENTNDADVYDFGAIMQQLSIQQNDSEISTQSLLSKEPLNQVPETDEETDSQGTQKEERIRALHTKESDEEVDTTLSLGSEAVVNEDGNDSKSKTGMSEESEPSFDNSDHDIVGLLDSVNKENSKTDMPQSIDSSVDEDMLVNEGHDSTHELSSI